MPLIMRRGPRRWIWWMRFGARQHERSASGPVVTRTSFGGGVGRRRVEQPDRRRAGGTTDRQPCSSSERPCSSSACGTDRQSVVWGKSVSVRVDFGGRRYNKKKKKN